MAVPVVLQTYPADLDTGIPIGISLHVVFDRGIDLSTAKDHVVLYGPDFDLTSGPDSAQWIDQETGSNPFFLSSPGFTGLVGLEATVEYVDLTTGPNYTVVTPGVLESEADEISANIGSKLILTPTNPLAADTVYTLHLLGDPDVVGAGISSRTVFDVVPDVGNSASTGSVLSNTSYTGSVSDVVVIEITTGGDIGTVKYSWYFASAGVGSAVTEAVSSRRFRLLTNGLQLRFTGSGFVAGDIYRFAVEPSERLATNIQLSFTSNDGSYSTAPSSPSTPATSLPPASTIPAAPGSMPSSELYITDSDPADGSYYHSLSDRTFVVQFNDDLDAATLTDSTVTIYRYPVSGLYNSQPQIEVLQKSLTVAGDQVTIQI